MSVSRILIVNLTRFGDLLQTSPTIAALRERHPGAVITVLAEKNFADVCDGIPGIDHVHRVNLDDLGARLLRGGVALIESYGMVEHLIAELRAQRFDLALNFSSSRMTAVFMGLLGVSDVRGWSMTPDGLRVIRHPWARLFATMCLNRRLASFNLVDYYRAMADDVGERRCLRYQFSPAAERFADDLLAAAGLRRHERLIALQLGASKDVRRWPAAAFAALGRRLVATGQRVLLIGGSGERRLAAVVAAEVGEGAIDACGKTGVEELGALLRRAELLVTGDTGPMHMAVAVGTPVIGLFFGPASPFDTGPYGPDNVLLHSSPACAPCDYNVTCLNPFCRDEITPEVVAAACEARLVGDWGALDRLAREQVGVRVYRTGFDSLGFYCCHALGAPSMRREDEIRAAYRGMWLAVLAGSPLPAARAATIDCAPFTALARLARDGEAMARRLHAEAGAREPSLDQIKRLGQEIELLDRVLLEHGAVHADTRVLTQMFKFGKENLEGDDVNTLADETAALYRGLALQTDLMTALLSSGREEKQSRKGANDRCTYQSMTES